jgi:hypothetical protein
LRKGFALMIAGVCIFSLLFGVFPSFAAAGNVNEIRLAADHTEYQVGETVKVTVNIQGALDVNGLEFTLRYPADKLRLQNGGMTLQSPYVSIGGERVDTGNGTLSYAVLPEDPVNAAESVVGEAVFTVLNEGEATLTLDGITAVDSHFREIQANTQAQIMLTAISQETNPPSSSEPPLQSSASGAASKPQEIDLEALIDDSIDKLRQRTMTSEEALDAFNRLIASIAQTFSQATAEAKSKASPKIADAIALVQEIVSTVGDKDIKITKSGNRFQAEISEETVTSKLTLLSGTTSRLKEKLASAQMTDIPVQPLKYISVRLMDPDKQAFLVRLPARSLDEIGSGGFDLVVNMGKVTLTLPPQTIPVIGETQKGQDSLIAISIEETDLIPVKEGSTLHPVGHPYEFQLSLESQGSIRTIARFDNTITVQLSYADADTGGVNPDKLGVYFHNPATRAWEYAGGRLDKSKQTLTFQTEHFSMYAIMENNRTFGDILTHWAKDDIERMAARHLVNGVDELHFAPEAKITRAQFTAMAVRMLGLEKTAYRNQFKDVRTGAWYAETVQAAADSGLIEGDGDVFRPDDTMTREEMAVILVRAHSKRNGTSSKQGVLERFEDQEEISEWAVDAVNTAVALGVVQGMSETQFMPQADATRAQAAVMIGRLDKILESDD